jgi:hypothetical protein
VLERGGGTVRHIVTFAENDPRARQEAARRKAWEEELGFAEYAYR